MLLNYEKENFLHLPTPVEYLPSISKDLGDEKIHTGGNSFYCRRK